MRHFGGKADALTKGRMRVNRFADVHRVGAHFNRQSDLTDHVARVGAHDATAQDTAVAMGCIAVVKQQLGKPFIASIGNSAARSAPGE